MVAMIVIMEDLSREWLGSSNKEFFILHLGLVGGIQVFWGGQNFHGDRVK